MTGEPTTELAFSLPAELVEQLNSWSAAAAEVNAELRKVIDPIAQASREITSYVDQAFSPIIESLKPLIEDERIARTLERAGWLPHDLIPVNLVQNDLPPNDLNAALEEYFGRDWAPIEDHLRTRFRSGNVDSETLEAMDEALFAHQHGRYRAACRTVFPEIERVARQRFYGLTHKGRITSLKEVKDAIGEIPITEFRPRGYWGFRLWKFLDTVCYADIDPSDLTNASTDRSLPNRHAVIHGLRSSSTMRDSLNVFFVADFMFQVLDILARSKPITSPQ